MDDEMGEKLGRKGKMRNAYKILVRKALREDTNCKT
jgi:predicted RNA-binding protein YlqC (UPF0109 family)